MASTSVTTLIDLQMSRQTELEVLYRTVKEQESHTFNLAIVEMYLERLKEICGGVRRTHEEILTLKIVELLQFLEQRARTLGAVARKTHAPKKEGTRAMRTIPGSRRVYHTTPSSSANVEIRCQGADHTLLHGATAHKSNARGPSAGNGSGETNKAEGQPSADFGLAAELAFLQERQRLPKGVYAGEALVENKNGKAYFKFHNTTSRFVSLKIPKLELLAYSIGTLPNLACDSYKSLSEIENSDLNECLHTLYNISKSTSADTSHTSKSPESPISPAPLRAVSVKKLLRLEHLNTEEAESVSKLIGKNADIFHLRGEPLSCTDILKHFFFINSIHHYNLSEDIW
ncbi:hypothetical protein M0802_015209 [Mischocyttarus mexicanus]|nr:hypothetical protein M0802_015209 [Mischocyttarus mexicanus]